MKFQLKKYRMKLTMDPLEELRSILCKFSVDDLKSHAMIYFPELSWIGVVRRVERLRQDLKPKIVAGAIVELARKNGVTAQEFKERIETLRLQEFSLSTKKTWYAYKLKEKSIDRDNEPIQQLAEAVGRSIDCPSVAVRAAHDINSIMIGIGRSRRSTVACLTDDCLFISPPLPKMFFIESLAKGLGYKTVKYSHLSGSHIPSLMRILQKGRGARNLENVLSKTKNTLKRGSDFALTVPIRERLQTVLGDENDAPLLPHLTIRAKTSASGGRTIYSKAVLSSSSAELSLRDMAEAGIVAPSSLFFSMLTDYGKNEIKVKIN